MVRALAINSTSFNACQSFAATTMRPMRGSTGKRASCLPSGVRWRPSSKAPNSCNNFTPSFTKRLSGASMKGNSSTGPNFKSCICRMTEARFVRKISASVNSGRPIKSASSYKRIQIPAETRPHRPLRWLALACEMASIGKRCTLER